MKHHFESFPTIFTKLKGQNGRMREYRAFVNPSTEYCVIPQVDAYYLNYTASPPNITTKEIANPDSVKMLVTYSGYINAALTTIKEVVIGSASFKDVEFLAYDLPQETQFDVVLGRSLFEHARIEIDYKLKILTIES